jgi:hypothetical protein
MNAQDMVLDRFPESVARLEATILPYDLEALIDGECWAIFAGPESDADEIGRGRTEVEAWSDAAGLLGNQAA